MRNFIVTVLIIFAAVCIISQAEAETYTASGEIALKQATSSFDKENVVTISLGEDIKLTCNMYIDDFFEKKIINAGAEIHNTSSDTMHCSYNVAFFDKDKNLVGCAAQNSFGDGLGPDEKTYLGSCLISLPHALFEKVKYYQIVLYTGKKEVGKE